MAVPLRLMLVALVALLARVSAQPSSGPIDPFTMSLSPPPRPGQQFTITWTPTSSIPSGPLAILLDYYFGSTPNQNIIETSTPIVENIPNSGTFVWTVPLNLIAGRYSFSIRAGPILTVSTSAIFTIDPSVVSSVSKSLTIFQTTACITSSSTSTPTGTNPFLIPSEDPLDTLRARAGRSTNIQWVPTTSGTISLLLTAIGHSGGSTTSNLALNVQNLGSFSWVPDSNIFNGQSDAGYSEVFLSIVPEGASLSSSLTRNSTEIVVLSPSSPNEFVFAPGNPPAVLGSSHEIMWDPSTAKLVSLVLFGGDSGGLTVNVTIADRISNNGSFTWQAPRNSPPIQAGLWSLAIFNGDTGSKDSTISFIINAQAAQLCRPPDLTTYVVLGSSTFSTITPSPSTTSSTSAGGSLQTRTHLTNPTFASGIYAQDLQITSCSTSIDPQFTSLLVNSTIINFVTVGCQAPSGSVSVSACHSGFQTFSIGETSSICCPNYWSTSLLGPQSMYCFTTTVPPTTITAEAKRELAPRASSTGPTPIVTAITLYNIVFAGAGVVAKNASVDQASGSIATTAATSTSSSCADMVRLWKGWCRWIYCLVISFSIAVTINA